MRFEQWKDEDLVDKVQSGHRDSADYAEELVRRYNHVCYEEAKDSIQKRFDLETREGECRLALTRAIAKYKPGKGTKFSSWAKQCMRNALKDMARMEMRRIEEVSITTSDDDAVCLEDVFASEASTDDEAAHELLWSRLHDLLSDITLSSQSVKIAGDICRELDPDGWSLFVGQGSLFAADVEAGRSAMVLKLKDFALLVVAEREQGYTFEDIAESTGTSVEACSLVMKLLQVLFAHDQYEVDSPDRPVLLLVEQVDIEADTTSPHGQRSLFAA